MAMTKGKTWAEQRKEQLKAVNIRVLELTGLTQDELSQLVFKQGLKWVSMRVDGDEMGVSILSSSSQFWNWYTNQWNILDEIWVANHTQHDDTDYLILDGMEGVCDIKTADKRVIKAEYIQLHSGELPAFVGEEVWEDIQERIINDKIKEVHNEIIKETTYAKQPIS